MYIFCFIVFTLHFLHTAISGPSNGLHYNDNTDSTEAQHDHLGHETDEENVPPPPRNRIWQQPTERTPHERPILSHEQQMPDVLKLLKKCFDQDMVMNHGPPINDMFVIKTYDGFRVVEISFSVNGMLDRSQCVLAMNSDSRNPKEDIVSVRRDNGQPIPKEHFHLPSSLQINIYRDGGNWEIVEIFNNGLFSLELVRSFIVQGMKMHRAYDPTVRPKLQLTDNSNIRELYFIAKRNGETFFQSEWNLEYDWMRDLTEASYLRLRQGVRNAFENPARTAMYASLDDVGGFSGFILPFAADFIQEFTAYNATKTPEQINSMTVGMVLEEFVPRWSSGYLYSTREAQILSQNTIAFFFRHCGNAEDIFTIALNGYSPTVLTNYMTGNPFDVDPHRFITVFRKNSPSLSGGRLYPIRWSSREGPHMHQAGSDSDSDEYDSILQNMQGNRMVGSRENTKVFNFAGVFILVFLSLFCRNKNEHGNFYSEL